MTATRTAFVVLAVILAGAAVLVGSGAGAVVLGVGALLCLVAGGVAGSGGVAGES